MTYATKEALEMASELLAEHTTKLASSSLGPIDRVLRHLGIAMSIQRVMDDRDDARAVARQLAQLVMFLSDTKTNPRPVAETVDAALKSALAYPDITKDKT
jgi:hypothetical protein